jgi:hypothetical protein
MAPACGSAWRQKYVGLQLVITTVIQRCRHSEVYCTVYSIFNNIALEVKCNTVPCILLKKVIEVYCIAYITVDHIVIDVQYTVLGILLLTILSLRCTVRCIPL